LIKNGANIHCETIKENTALSFANKNNNKEMIALLNEAKNKRLINK